MEKTEPQIEYVRSLQRRLKLPDDVLDQHCRRTFVKSFAEIDRRETTELLSAMADWEQLPADLQRAKGQLDLF